MELHRDDLVWAVGEGLLSQEAAERLWVRLEEQAAARAALGASIHVSPATGRVTALPLPAVVARFDLVHVAWYAGTLLILGAMGWFATLGFERWGGPGLLAIAASYGGLFGAAGWRLWRTADRRVLGGVLVTAAVGMVPLATYALENVLDLWPDRAPGAYVGFYDWVKGGWFGLELATIVAGVLVMRRVRFSFVGLPVAIAVWFMSMDVGPLLAGEELSRETGAAASIAVGVAALAIVWILRLRDGQEDVVRLLYWVEIASLLAIDGGIANLGSGSFGGRLFVLVLHAGAIAAWQWTRHAAYAVVGLAGVATIAASALNDGSHGVALAAGVIVTTLLVGTYLQHRRARWVAAGLFIVGGASAVITLYDGLHDSGAAFFAYPATGAAFVLYGVFARSRLLVAAGGASAAAWLVWASNRLFADSMVFPIALVSIGIGVIAVGAVVHRRQDAIDAFVERTLPLGLRRLRPPAPIRA